MKMVSEGVKWGNHVHWVSFSESKALGHNHFVPVPRPGAGVLFIMTYMMRLCLKVPFSQVLQRFLVRHYNFRVNVNQNMLCAILILCNFLVLLF